MALAAACGGGEEPRERVIRGDGFTARVPYDWRIERAGRTIRAARRDGVETVAVTTFRLARPYRPQLWPEVVEELDGVAERLARALDPSARVVSGDTTRIARRRGRVYLMSYGHEGERLIERVGFVLEGRVEYQLLCRWSDKTHFAGRAACRRLFRSFRLA